MDYVGIDVHKKQSQSCIVTAAGDLRHQHTESHRERFVAVFAGGPTARILIAASPESEWVAQCWEALGHALIVADPHYVPMYAQRSRRGKTDRRDADDQPRYRTDSGAMVMQKFGTMELPDVFCS